MTTEEKKKDDEFAKILLGLEQTYKNLVKFKREKNSPIIVSQDGKIVALDPFSVPESISSEKEVEK
jgi:hypothetical protein